MKTITYYIVRHIPTGMCISNKSKSTLSEPEAGSLELFKSISSAKNYMNRAIKSWSSNIDDIQRTTEYYTNIMSDPKYNTKD